MGYSSREFSHTWRYAVSTPFVSPSGDPFTYAPNGKQRWGRDEWLRFPFADPPTTAAVSHDGEILAVAVKSEIHLFALRGSEPGRKLRVLRGHTARVDVLAFRPRGRAELVSCAMGFERDGQVDGPSIVFWEVGGEAEEKGNGEEVDVADISKHAVRAVVERLSDVDASLHLAAAEQELLAEAFAPGIERALARMNVAGNLKVCGRLQDSFQSNVFSPSGRFMLYLPGRSPRSNGDEKWDVVVFDVDEKKNALTLVGHRDSIMWLGYSPDESKIGSVCWDKTMKIWDASTGEVKYSFETNGQNWTGGFSPDGKMFAGTCGDGSIHVYSLHDGTEIFALDFGKRWCRVLNWSPQSNILAVGGQDFGKLILIDMMKKVVVQERTLSVSRVKVRKEEMRGMLGGFLEVYAVKFVDEGRKIVHFTSGDGSAEVFDLRTHIKWRFARAGTDSYGEEESGEKLAGETDTEEQGKEEDSKAVDGGFGMIVWQDASKGVVVATIDQDAVRLWSVPLLQ